MNDLLEKLIQFESITPQDAGCQEYMIDFFQQLGFQCTRFNNPPVANFFAQLGNKSPLLIFAGHTDVVPIGDISQWDSHPFILKEKEGTLYGRGVADMKGSLACMMMMAQRFVQEHASFKGSLGFLITSGEEGDDFNLGTPYVMEQLQHQGIHPQFCIVGEPSSNKRIGDTIKIGRRGSLTGKLLLQGKQGHVAYPHLAENPIHILAPALAALIATPWDQGNAYFPPTSLQVTKIQAGGEANNLIPGTVDLHFNFRFSTEQTAETLKAAVHSCFQQHGLKPSIEWQLNGEPFLTQQGSLVQSTIQSIQTITHQVPELSTTGGTSDARFIAPYGVEVIELGPLNATIHQVNECVDLADLETLTSIYSLICKELLT